MPSEGISVWMVSVLTFHFSPELHGHMTERRHSDCLQQFCFEHFFSYITWQIDCALQKQTETPCVVVFFLNWRRCTIFLLLSISECLLCFLNAITQMFSDWLHTGQGQQALGYTKHQIVARCQQRGATLCHRSLASTYPLRGSTVNRARGSQNTRGWIKVTSALHHTQDPTGSTGTQEWRDASLELRTPLKEWQGENLSAWVG